MAKRSTVAVESWWYVLESDRALPKGEQSRFLLRPLTVAERARIADDIVAGTRRTYTDGFQILSSHIERVENFPAGAPEPWPARHSEREAYLGKLYLDNVAELAAEVINKGLGFSDATEKEAATEGEPAAPRDAEREAQSVPNS